LRTRDEGFHIRSFEEGDEAALARLFNSYLECFVGPTRVTAASWRRQFTRQGWKAPSFADAECCRVAELPAGGVVLGYAVTDYQPMWAEGGAILQELCVAEVERAEAVMRALIEDAEERALARGKRVLILELSSEDGLVEAAASALGYAERLDEGVFMAAVTDLAACLLDLAPALTARLAGSVLAGWSGAIRITSGEQMAGLVAARQAVRAAPPPQAPDISVVIHPDWLPSLLLGRASIGELYLQDAAAVSAPDIGEALRLLDVFFPVLPVYLPRAQWW